MMTVVFVVSALVAAALLTELIAANRAPVGYQDESGFHFGRPHYASPKVFDSENPS